MQGEKSFAVAEYFCGNQLRVLCPLFQPLHTHTARFIAHTMQGSLCMSLLCECIQGSEVDVQASAEAVAAAAAKVNCANKVRYCVLF